jgi:large exoprotein involved in heme utilization and adhesion
VGGNIEITAQGIFGIEPRGELTPKSDITADSKIGIDGEIEINTLDFDARNSLTSLASNFVTTEKVVAGSCLARRNTQQGSFVVTGSGGLPIAPYSGIAEWDSLTGVQPKIGVSLSEARPQPTTSQLSSQSVEENYTTNWKPGDPIIEAQGIVVTADGRTLLDMKPQQVATVDPETLVCAADSPES